MFVDLVNTSVWSCDELLLIEAQKASIVISGRVRAEPSTDSLSILRAKPKVVAALKADVSPSLTAS